MDEIRFVEMINEEITELTLEIKDCADSMVPVKGLQMGTLQKLLHKVENETFLNAEEFKFKINRRDEEFK